MKKENLTMVIGIAILIAFFVGVYMLYQLPEEKDQTVTTSPTPQVQVSVAPQNDSPNPNYGELTEDQISIADIAIGSLLNSSEGVTPPMISVVRFQEQEFSDASLGCPQEGQMYAQAVTFGYQVVLSAQGQEYDYRLTDAENVFLCEQ